MENHISYVLDNDIKRFIDEFSKHGISTFDAQNDYIIIYRPLRTRKDFFRRYENCQHNQKYLSIVTCLCRP